MSPVEGPWVYVPAMDIAWWKDLGERTLRNEIQALLPLLALLATAGRSVTVSEIGLSVLYVGVWTVVKGLAFSLVAYEPTGTSAGVWRVISAVAASVVANLPEQFWGFDHWDRVAYGAAGAVLTCLMMLVGTPPTSPSLPRRSDSAE